MENSKKLLFVFIAILFLLASIAGLFIIRNINNSKEKDTPQNQTDTDVSEQTNDQEETVGSDNNNLDKDWVKHTFSKLGFEIQVPRDWSYKSVPARPDQTVVEFYDEDKNNIILRVRNYPGSYGWCEEDTLEGPTSTNSPWEEIIIDNQPYQISWCGESTFMIVEDYTKLDGLEFIGIKTHDGINIVGNIISTVEFL